MYKNVRQRWASLGTGFYLYTTLPFPESSVWISLAFSSPKASSLITWMKNVCASSPIWTLLRCPWAYTSIGCQKHRSWLSRSQMQAESLSNCRYIMPWSVTTWWAAKGAKLGQPPPPDHLLLTWNKTPLSSKCACCLLFSGGGAHGLGQRSQGNRAVSFVTVVNRKGGMKQMTAHALLGRQLAAAVSLFTLKVTFQTATAGCSKCRGN